MRYLLLWVLAGCGSSVVVGADGEGGSSGSASSSSGSGGCLPCFSTTSEHFLDRLCPGEETDKYEALIACACREDTCGAPTGECHDPDGFGYYLCDGGYVGSGCAGCLGDHCLEEFFACKGQEPP
jgi:hypothetical protein